MLFEGLCIGAVGIGSIGFVIPVVVARFGSIALSAVPLTLSVSVPAILLVVAVSDFGVLFVVFVTMLYAAGRIK